MSSACTCWETLTASTVVCETSKGRPPHEDQNTPNMSAFSVSVEAHPDFEPSVLDGEDAETFSSEKIDSSLSPFSSSYGSPPYITSRHLPDMMFVPPGEAHLQQKIGKANRHIMYSFSSLTDCDIDRVRQWQLENVIDGSISHHHYLAGKLLLEGKHCDCFPADSDVDDSECISSCSSLSEGSVCTSVNGSEVILEESEAQSSYKGPLDCMASLEAALPIRRSLSRFFFGQSRSFSCLGDVVSVTDLAKPKNPYARNRKCVASLNSGTERPRLSPIGAGIKKPPHNNKSTLGLAVAMSTRDARRKET